MSKSGREVKKGEGSRSTDESKEQKSVAVSAVPVIVDLDSSPDSTLRSPDSIFPLTNDLWLGMHIHPAPLLTCWWFRNIDAPLPLRIVHSSAAAHLLFGAALLRVNDKTLTIRGNLITVFEVKKISYPEQLDVVIKSQVEIFDVKEEVRVFGYMSMSRKPLSTKVFFDDQHAMLQYDKRIVIFDIDALSTFIFTISDKYDVSALTINKDNTIIAFPRPLRDEPLPNFYFLITVDFENHAAKIEEKPCVLPYSQVTHASCLAPNVLLLTAEQKEDNTPMMLYKCTIGDDKSINPGTVFGKIVSPKRLAVLSTGDFVWQQPNRKIKVIYNADERNAYSCDFPTEIKSMSVCRDRLIHFSNNSWSVPSEQFCSLPKFSDDLRPLLEEHLNANVADIVFQYNGFTVNDSSVGMFLPTSPMLKYTGATLMSDPPIQSFNHLEYWKKRIDKVDSVNDLKHVIEDASAQILSLLILTSGYIPSINGLRLLQRFLFNLKSTIDTPGSLLSQNPNINLIPETDQNINLYSLVLIRFWNALYEKAKQIPELLAEEQATGIVEYKDYRVTTWLGEAEDITKRLFERINTKEQPIVSLVKMVEWLKAAERFQQLHDDKSKKSFLTQPIASFMTMFKTLPPSGEVTDLVKIRDQIEKLLSQSKDKQIAGLGGICVLLTNFANKEGCPKALASQMKELVPQFSKQEAKEHKKNLTEEEAQLFKLFQDVIAKGSESKNNKPILVAINAWLEIANAQTPIPAEQGIFSEKEQASQIKDFKRGIATTRQWLRVSQDAIDMDDSHWIKDINERLLELVMHQGCPKRLADQMKDITSFLAKHIPKGPAQVI